MKFEKNDARKSEIIAHCKREYPQCENRWNQEDNADMIIKRMIMHGAALRAAQPELFKAFAIEMIKDAQVLGLGLYGNASQMAKSLAGDKPKGETKSASADSLCAAYGL